MEQTHTNGVSKTLNPRLQRICDSYRDLAVKVGGAPLLLDVADAAGVKGVDNNSRRGNVSGALKTIRERGVVLPFDEGRTQTTSKTLPAKKYPKKYKTTKKAVAAAPKAKPGPKPRVVPKPPLAAPQNALKQLVARVGGTSPAAMRVDLSEWRTKLLGFKRDVDEQVESIDKLLKFL